jgi:hypothetical protein
LSIGYIYRSPGDPSTRLLTHDPICFSRVDRNENSAPPFGPGIAQGVTMHDPFFAVPIIVETEAVGKFRILSSVSDAAIFMMERWPESHGPSYRAALQACTGSLSTAEDVENARHAFVTAAKEAGLNLKAVAVQEGDPSRRSAEQPKSAYIIDEKRRDRGDREEQEDFLVRFLTRETGITEAQARDLVNMIGTDRASLLREARILKGRDR